MLLVFCDNYREVQKLNVFVNTENVPYIEFYIPRKYTDIKLCKTFEIEKTVEEIKNGLAEDEWISSLNVAGISNDSSCISYETTKEVMYEIPLEGSTHEEVKHLINTMIKNNEVINIDRIQKDLNKTKASTIGTFAENIIRRI